MLRRSYRIVKQQWAELVTYLSGAFAAHFPSNRTGTLTVAAAAILSATAAAETPPAAPISHSDVREERGYHYLALYSRVAPNTGGYEFFLFPEALQTQFLRERSSDQFSALNLHQLKAKFAKLPKNSGVAWRDDKDSHFGYAPLALTEQVKHFAAARGVRLIVLPTVYD